jgi:hypothetical protein
VATKKVLAPVTLAPCNERNQDQQFRFRNTGTTDTGPKFAIVASPSIYLVADPNRDMLPDSTGILASRTAGPAPEAGASFVITPI